MNSRKLVSLLATNFFLVYCLPVATPISNDHLRIAQGILHSPLVVMGQATDAMYVRVQVPNRIVDLDKSIHPYLAIAYKFHIEEVLKGPDTGSEITLLATCSRAASEQDHPSVTNAAGIFVLSMKSLDGWWLHGSVGGSLNFPIRANAPEDERLTEYLRTRRDLIKRILERDTRKEMLIEKADTIILGRIYEGKMNEDIPEGAEKIPMKMELLRVYKGKLVSPVIKVHLPIENQHDPLNKGELIVIYLSGEESGDYQVCGGLAGFVPVQKGRIPYYYSENNAEGMTLFEFKKLIDEVIN